MLHYYVCYTEKKNSLITVLLGRQKPTMIPRKAHINQCLGQIFPAEFCLSNLVYFYLKKKNGLFILKFNSETKPTKLKFIYIFFITKPTLNFILLKNAMSIYKNTTCTMMCVEILNLDLIKIVTKPFSFIRYLSLVKEIKYGCLTLNFQA